MLTLKEQEVAFDSEESDNMFQPSAEKPLLATPGAIQEHTLEQIMACLARFQHFAAVHNGADYIAVFENDVNTGEEVQRLSVEKCSARG